MLSAINISVYDVKVLGGLGGRDAAACLASPMGRADYDAFKAILLTAIVHGPDGRNYLENGKIPWKMVMVSTS